MNEFVNKANARPGGYDKVIANIAAQNICPFCPEYLTEFHKRPMKRHKFWIVTDNQFPYTPSKHHKLIIHAEHIDHVSKIVPEAWAELYGIIQELVGENAITGGTFLLRFGETRFTGASVTHLHANLVQSNPEDPSYDSAVGLRTRVG